MAIRGSQEWKDNIGRGNLGLKKPKISIALTGRTLSNEHKEKIRQTLLGRKLTDEWKQKIAKSNTGKKYTPQQLLNMSNGIKNKWKDPLYRQKQLNRIPYRWTEEQKKKSSETYLKKYSEGYISPSLGIKLSPERKKQISLESKRQVKLCIENNIPYGNFGNKLSEEVRRNMSVNRMGKSKGYEHAEKLRTQIILINKSESHRKLVKEKMKGRIFSDKTLQKMRLAPRNLSMKIYSSIHKKICDFLTELNIDFVKEKHFPQITNSYFCDVFIPKYNLIIECDGDYWHCNPLKWSEDRYHTLKKKTAKQIWDIDRCRTQDLEKIGYKVLRIWETDIKTMDIESFSNILNTKILA